MAIKEGENHLHLVFHLRRTTLNFPASICSLLLLRRTNGLVWKVLVPSYRPRRRHNPSNPKRKILVRQMNWTSSIRIQERKGSNNLEVRIRKPIPCNQHPFPDKASEPTTFWIPTCFSTDWRPNRLLDHPDFILSHSRKPKK